MADDLEQHMDVIVKKEGERYRATCPVFPGCKGLGETEGESLEKLSQSIGRYVSKSTSTYLKKLFKKEHSEVVIDPNRSSDLQHRIYSLDKADQSSDNGRIMLKLRSYQPIEKQAVNRDEDIIQFIEHLRKPHSDSMLLESLSQIVGSSQDNDFLFGIQLSLN